MDATLAPADITYPTDIDVVAKARESSEAIITRVIDKKREKQFIGNAEPQLGIGVRMVFYANEKLQIGTAQ